MLQVPFIDTKWKTKKKNTEKFINLTFLRPKVYVFKLHMIFISSASVCVQVVDTAETQQDKPMWA